MIKLLLPVGFFALAACGNEITRKENIDTTPFPLAVPPGFPELPTDTANPLTMASVRLGKALFFEKRLSRDGTMSCASCHRPDHAFSDTLEFSTGVHGNTGMRNAPSLGNVGYQESLFLDGGVPTLEMQVLSPVGDPLEMDHRITDAAEGLAGEEPYRSMSLRAYGRPLDVYVVTRALANYERTLISGSSKYDRSMLGDSNALSAAEKRGLALFSSVELNCTACHSGFDLSDHGFHNIGLLMHYADTGRARITVRHSDVGKFRTPSLRNIALTAPYMHDGSMATLDDVIDHFASGGLPHPNRDPEMHNFVISEEQKRDLIAFLHALTDEEPIDRVP